MLSTERLFSFKYNGTPFWDLPYTVTKETEGNVTRARYTLPDGFCLTVRRTDYPEEGGVEWVNTFSNRGSAPSGIVSELFDADVTVPFSHEDPRRWTATFPERETATKIYAPFGSDWSADEFACPVDRIKENRRVYHIYPGERRSYATEGGRSAQTYAPFFQVTKEDRGVFAAVGWSGQWNAHIERGEDSLRFLWGVEGARFRVLPGESFRTASAVLMPYEGDAVLGRILWRRFMKRHFSLIGTEGRDAYGPLCASIWGGMHTSAVMERLDVIEKKDLPFEYIWMDAGWYGKDTQPTPDEFEGDWATHTGEWVVSPHIHPGGLRDVAARCHGMGKKFLLWFEPERVIDGTPITREHPEYFLRHGSSRNLLLDLSKPEAERYCLDTLSRLIEDIGVDCYRQDFNFAPLPYWRGADTEERQGIHEILHINALYRIWDALLARFPHLFIDNCASGGRRNDIELLRRSMPLWRSDYQCPANHDPEVVQCHTVSYNSFLPYSGSGSGRLWDTYRFRSAMAASLTTNYTYSQRDTFGDDEEKLAWLGSMLREYLRARPYFTEDMVPLTEHSAALDVWCATQYHRPSDGTGLLTVFRREHSPYETAKFALRFLEEDATYRIKDTDGTFDGTFTGKELTEGISLSQEKRSAKLYFYEKVKV